VATGKVANVEMRVIIVRCKSTRFGCWSLIKTTDATTSKSENAGGGPSASPCKVDQNYASGDGTTRPCPTAIRNPHERFSMWWWGRVLFSQNLVDTLAFDLTLRCLYRCVGVWVCARVEAQPLR
jgi:hypothetical protein